MQSMRNCRIYAINLDIFYIYSHRPLNKAKISSKILETKRKITHNELRDF